MKRRIRSPIPKRNQPDFQNDPHLSLGERQVLARLWKRGARHLKCWGTREQLARWCGVSLDQLKRHLNYLEWRDYIRIKRREEPRRRRESWYFLIEAHEMNQDDQFRLTMPGERFPTPREIRIRADHRMALKPVDKAVDSLLKQEERTGQIRTPFSPDPGQIRPTLSLEEFRNRKHVNDLSDAEAG